MCKELVIQYNWMITKSNDTLKFVNTTFSSTLYLEILENKLNLWEKRF